MVNDTCLETVNWWGKENMQPFLTSLTVTYLLAELDHLHQWPEVLVGFVVWLFLFGVTRNFLVHRLSFICRHQSP